MNFRTLFLSLACVLGLVLNPASAITTANGVPTTQTVATAWASSAESQVITRAEAEAFVNMKAKDVQAATGRKLRVGERVALAYAKRQMKRELRKNKDADHFSAKGNDEGFGLGILLGLFLGLIGVVLAYVLKKDKPRIVKGAWLGLGIAVLLWIILVAAVFGAAASTVS